LTDEGEKEIQKLVPGKDSINGLKVVAITKSIPFDKYLVNIKKNALGMNVPNKDTLISKNHKVMLNGEMMKAKELVSKCNDVYKVAYNKEILFNILLEKHENMKVNNLEVETLHPENIGVKIALVKDSKERLRLLRYYNRALSFRSSMLKR